MGDGLWLAIQTEDFDAATDAAGEMRDLLELILSGVGWGRNGSAVTPSMDLLAMMRALERLNLPWRSKDLSRAERDEIYAAVQGRLRLMGDLWIHVGQGDFANADRLAREFVDLLHLIPGELGWGGEGVTTELRLSEARLQRTFGYLREITAEAQLAHDLRVAEARARERASAKTTSLVLEVCERVLSETES